MTSCYQSQNYKIWKQFTTTTKTRLYAGKLLSIIKLQNLKVIHNASFTVFWCNKVVINHKTTKFESNSQLIPRSTFPAIVVINHNTIKFESNSQLAVCSGVYWYCCYQSRNYKIWKQFTTHFESLRTFFTLLSITKLQNLKAIHNWCYYLRLSVKVVINHKITKYESNSQRMV